jgi:hypothetical protein
VQDVLGVEIRPEQVQQATLIRELAPERFAGVRFEHDPTSADDAAFRAGEHYDVVLSFGLLYHLTDPFTHLRNLRRLAGRAAVVKTLTHARERGFWMYVPEEPSLMTKATSGVSWIPHFADVPEHLRAAGFSQVETITRPSFRQAHARDARVRSRTERLLAPGAVHALRGRLDARSAEREGVGVAARYYTYLAR